VLLAVAKCVHAAMSAHASTYAAAPVAMATFLALIQALDEGQQGVRNRTMTGAERDLRRDAVWSALEALRVFVQSLCDESPEQALTLIQNAGLEVADAPVHAKPLLGVRQGPQAGMVILEAHAGLLATGKGRMFFNWEYTVNGGASWIAVPSTPWARTTIAGLPALVTCGFRVSVTDPVGQGEWSQVVALLVH
jgi:hypothetical protein